MRYSKAEFIKNRLSMLDIIEKYEHQTPVNGRIRCFLHNGKDRNMRVYEHSVYCFVCNGTVDIFSYIQREFNIGFAKACDKLDRDFRLGLGSDYKPSLREKREAVKKQIKRQEEIKKDKEYQNLNSLLAYYYAVKKRYETEQRPESIDGFPEIYVRAVKQIPYIEFLLEGDFLSDENTRRCAV